MVKLLFLDMDSKEDVHFDLCPSFDWLELLHNQCLPHTKGEKKSNQDLFADGDELDYTRYTG